MSTLGSKDHPSDNDSIFTEENELVPNFVQRGLPSTADDGLHEKLVR